MAATTGVLIVNFNAGDALRRCVESVLSQGEPVAITVVDNASVDGSAQRLDNATENVQIVFNEQNVGFARAVNQAARQCFDSTAGRDTDLLLILNPDCEIRPGALRRLREALEADDGAGLAAPRVVDDRDEPLRGTYRAFPDPWRSFLTFSGLWRLGSRIPLFRGVEPIGPLPETTVRAEAVSGACMLVRANLFQDLDGLDEAYGMHCEDLDLMYRLRQRGLACLFVPTAVVFHARGVSSRSRPVWVHFQKHRGMQRFYSKFQAREHHVLFRWFVISGIWLRFILTLPLALLKR
jgi:GT2 family glycosyltransferase